MLAQRLAPYISCFRYVAAALLFTEICGSLTVIPTDGGTFKTDYAAFDTVPAIVMLSPPREGARLPAEDGSSGASLNISYEIFASAYLLAYIKAEVCMQIEMVEIGETEGSEYFDLVDRGTPHCFTGRARELKASGLAPGDYRLNITMKVPFHDSDSGVEDIQDVPSASARFRVLSKVPFVPSYEWQRVEEWQDVMSGLDVKLPIGGTGFKKARIPQNWKLQAWIIDDAGKKKDAGSFVRISIGRQDTLLSVRAAVAEAVNSGLPCLTLSIGGSEAEWIALENSSESTVEFARLFERGLPIAGRVDRVQGVCSCYPPGAPGKGRACAKVLAQLEACESVAVGQRGHLETCIEAASAVEDCFTTCSFQGDPYASPRVPVPVGLEDNASVLLPAAIGSPELPLRQGWSELQWGGEEGWPAHVRWARCKQCGYKIGTWGGLVIHTPLEYNQSRENLPDDMASSRYAPWFRTHRGAYPSARLELLHSEYDETSARCGSGTGVVSSPTFIVAVWDVLNIYHLIANLLLPFYRAIVDSYGLFREDALLFLEVGHPEQAPLLQQLLKQGSLEDTSLNMLSRLTRRPVASAASLERGVHIADASVDQLLCFRDLHLGLDSRNTSLAFSLSRPSHYLDSKSLEGLEAIRWQQMLSLHLWGQLPSLPIPLPPGLLFVKRLQTRKFKNFVELKSIARAIAKEATDRVLASTTTTTRLAFNAGGANVDGTIFPSTWKGWTNEIVPERVPFHKQLAQYRQSTVLIAVHGQGAANAFFMRPGSSLILIVPPKFTIEKFLFANFAVASGVHVFLIESEGRLNATGINATTEAQLEWLDEAKREIETWVDPSSFALILKAVVVSASMKFSEEPAQIHSWEEVQKIAMDEEAKAKSIAEEKAAAEAIVAEKTEQRVAENDTSPTISNQTTEMLAVLEEIRQAKARLLDLESKLSEIKSARQEL